MDEVDAIVATHRSLPNEDK
jgi:hypothetical protein